MNKKCFTYIFVLLLLLLLIFINKETISIILHNTCISFSRTLIEENRYVLYLQGLKVTLIISILSIIIGTILGFLIFLIQKSQIDFLKLTGSLFIKIIQGIPITVLLLIFYFVIFGKININPVIVAIITFSIYFSAYVSEIFKGAYASINKIQITSAYALGFNKWQTLKKIIIPQVLVYVIPVYKNEVVSLIKLTSISGYISIMELTKASDIIRNRTYEAFFPLIFTALIYFILCYFVGKSLDYINIKINPRLVIK